MEKNKKILYIITKSNWGGAQRYVFDLAITMQSRGYDVVVALGGEGILQTRLLVGGVRVLPIPSLGRDISVGKDAGSFKELYKIIKKEKPDILHLNSPKAAGLGALAGRLLRVPRIIQTVHGFTFSEDRPWIQRTAIKFFSWITILLSHITITVSDFDARAVASWPFIAGKVTVIHNGVKEIKILDKEAARTRLHFEHHLPITPILIGTVAELHKNKGLSYLIQAFAELPQTASLCIIGNGEERETLIAQAKHIGVEKRVCLVGFIPDAVRFISAFDIFVLPSLKEGLPYVLFEAGLASLPTVATNVGGIPEIVRDKKSGLIVEPKNVRELSDALLFMVNNAKRRGAYGAALHAHVKSQFSFEKMVVETEKLY